VARGVAVLIDQPAINPRPARPWIDDDESRILHQERDGPAVGSPHHDVAPILVLRQSPHHPRLASCRTNPQTLGGRVDARVVSYERPVVAVWRDDRNGYRREAEVLGRAGTEDQRHARRKPHACDPRATKGTDSAPRHLR